MIEYGVMSVLVKKTVSYKIKSNNSLLAIVAFYFIPFCNKSAQGDSLICSLCGQSHH